MKQIVQIFENSFKNKSLSWSDEKNIKKIICENNLSDIQINNLQKKVFEIIKNNTAPTKAYMIDWAEKTIKTLQASSQANTKTNLYFSPGTDCLNAIIKQLNSAKKKVDICVFTISDNRITGSIVDCEIRGVKVKVLSDNDKLFDKGSDIDYLVRKGVEVRVDKTSAHMHHKFAVIDDSIAITGSYNWTRSAEKYNHENIIVTNDKTIVKSYSKEFKKLWNEMKMYY